MREIIPTLPRLGQCCLAHCQLIPVSRNIVPAVHIEQHIRSPAIEQGLYHIAITDITGRQGVAPATNIIDQILKHDLFVLRLYQTDVQGHGIRRLTVPIVLPGLFIKEFLIKCLFYRCGQLPIFLHIFALSEQFGSLLHDLNILIIDGRCTQPIRGQLSKSRFGRTQIAPIPQTISNDMTICLGRKVIDILSHLVVILFDGPFVAIPLIKVPRNNNVGASPLRSIEKSIGKDRVLRSDRWYHTTLMLRSGHIVHDLREGPTHVITVMNRRSDQVRLFEPAQLLPVGTIGKYAGKVTADGPVDQRIDSVE